MRRLGIFNHFSGIFISSTKMFLLICSKNDNFLPGIFKTSYVIKYLLDCRNQIDAIGKNSDIESNMLCLEKNCVFAKIFAVSPKILLRRQTFTKCCARLLGLHLYALCIASFSKHNKRIDELLLWDYKNLGFLAIHSLRNIL